MGETKLTGYPSVDRPWLKYYTEEAIHTPMTELSVYEYLTDSNRDNRKGTALVYMGRNLSYQTLFDSIEDVAKAFAKLGLVKGDVAACIAPSFPEVIYSFYAANKLGAISNYFDPRTEPQVIYDELEQVKPKLFLIFDDFLPKFQEMIDKLNIPNVIVVSAKDSLPFPVKILASLKRKPIPQGYIPFAQILKDSKGSAAVKTVTDIPHEIALMEHTGGTTGTPKAVCLTNQNVNAVIHQYHLGGGQHDRKESWLAVGFPFIAYSLICSIHMPLVYGMSLHLCFTVDTPHITKMVIGKRINHMANTPITWEEILHSKRAQKTDLSFLINPTVGADSMSKETELQINSFLKSHNCKYEISKGYGITEAGSGVSINFSEICNRIGSVGIPFPHTTISIFDPESGNELKYGEKGEICIMGPSVMKEYYNDPEATRSVLRKHADGNVWLHSGDLGHMDEDGFLFVDGRIKRMIIDHHGFKIFAPEIEKTLFKHEGIEKCCVVGASDTEHKIGQIAVAFMIKKQGFAISEDELRELCKRELPDHYMPGKFVFVNEFPYTSAAKVDFRKLEEMAAQGE